MSRYYDPETGRFISPDAIEYLDPSTIGGLNLYAYCNNNPVMYVDPSGHFVISLLVGTAVAFALGATVSVVSQGIKYGWDNISVWQVLLDGTTAAASVLLSATGISLFGSMLLGSAMSVGQYVAGSVIHGEDITLLGVLISVTIGFLSGLISGAGARNMKAIAKSLEGRASQGLKALVTTASRYGINSRQVALVNNLYRSAINSAIKVKMAKSITGASLTTWISTVFSGIVGIFT